MSLLERFLEEIQRSESLDTAKAFGKAAQMALEQNTMQDLVLEGHGEGMKISVIRELRTIFSHGLKEAKDLSETPNAVLGRFNRADAARYKTQLEGAGAQVRLV